MNFDTRSHVHALVDQLPQVQLAALETILRSMLPCTTLGIGAIGDHPFAEEQFTEADREAVAEADEWLQANDPIPLESVLADLGLTMTDWEVMAKTPLHEEYRKPNG